MSKTKTLFTMALLVLLGSMGVVQAQTIARVTLLTAPEAAAREGGKNEAAGDVFLDIDGVPESIASYTLTYSVPVVAASVTGLTGYAAADSDLEDGEVAFGALSGGTDDVVAITGVRLDVSGADSGPVTVTLSVENAEDDLALMIGSATMPVFTEILPGVKTTAKKDTVRTRGGEATATFTIDPGFKGAFEVGQKVEVEVEGIPENVRVMVEAADADPPNEDDTADPLVPTPRPVTGAKTLTGDADGDDKSFILTLGNADATALTARGALSDGVTLTLTLMTKNTTTTTTDDVSLPLMMGNITASVTLVDTEMGVDIFDDAFTSPMTIFEIRPAQCTLLFPVVSVLPDGNWDTAISINNPGYKTTPTSETASGGLTLTFYGMDNPAVAYETTGMPTGVGLDEDGTLRPGGTYQVLVSQILAATGWGATFRGHVHVRADYTNCSGLGWVTDFMGVNQAYTATVIDSDTGMDAAHE